MPPGREGGPISAVARADYEFEGLSGGLNGARSELGFMERAADEVRAVKSGVRSGDGGRLGGKRVGGGEVEEGNRKMGEGIGDTGVAGFGDVDSVATVVGEGGAEIETTESVVPPGGAD